MVAPILLIFLKVIDNSVDVNNGATPLKRVTSLLTSDLLYVVHNTVQVSIKHYDFST